jgi:carboxynorspermidine decarboxylase
LKTPAYVLEEEKLERNLELLQKVNRESGIEILMALKGFALWNSFSTVKKYLSGTSASGLHEALLGFEEFGDEVHTYSPAFNPNEFPKILEISKTIIFNSFSQLEKYYEISKHREIGIRVNPEYSSTAVEIYNPCSPYSRLGVIKSEFREELIEKIDGFHFHALCEQGIEDLEPLWNAFEEKFGKWLSKVKWVNMGGGHLITREGYDVERFIKFGKRVREKYPHLKFYIEPSEAIGWETGYLISTVLDIVENGIEIAILDTSAEAHMPDVLAMPYRPNVVGDTPDGKFSYRFSGNSCLAGDIIGDYKFEKPLKVGDKIIFKDMIHYTMVKNTTFNGLPLPTIATQKDGEIRIIKEFGYLDYKNRLS